MHFMSAPSRLMVTGAGPPTPVTVRAYRDSGVGTDARAGLDATDRRLTEPCVVPEPVPSHRDEPAERVGHRTHDRLRIRAVAVRLRPRLRERLATHEQGRVDVGEGGRRAGVGEQRRTGGHDEPEPFVLADLTEP